MKSLNIWWVSQYASTPDQQFTAQHDLAKRLAAKGHRVTIFAAGFSHYKFKEVRLKPGENWRSEECEGVRFIWLRTSPYNANDWKRVVNMVSYGWKAYRVGRKLEPEVDVIIGTTVQPLAALSAYALSVAKCCRFVFEVRDLWPLTLIQFGKLSPNNPLAFCLAALEKFLARKADRVLSTLPGADTYFQRYGIPKERVVWIPNGLELSRYRELKAYDGHLGERFTLLYAGGHVQANSLHTILKAAQIEQENGNRGRFLFVGGGQAKPELLELARELGLRNVEFRDPVPKNELHRLLGEADAFILSMRDLPDLYRYGISFNKLCDYVAAGRPVLFAGNPSNNVVEEFQCGIVAAPENPNAFADAIHKFEDLTPAERAEMGRNALRCARERFDVVKLGDRLESTLLAVVEKSTASRSAPDPAP
jgi:glycosyltransferase involved in cell wall biosynthesis